jgi:hypothetical protein
MRKAIFPIYEIKYGTLINPYPCYAVVSSGEGVKFAKRSLEDNLVRKRKADGLRIVEVRDTGANSDEEGVLSLGIE